MKFNKEQLDALVALPDDILWAEIVRTAKSYGVSLPESAPPHSELEKLRGTVKGANINVSEALRLLKTYKKG